MWNCSFDQSDSFISRVPEADAFRPLLLLMHRQIQLRKSACYDLHTRYGKGLLNVENKWLHTIVEKGLMADPVTLAIVCIAGLAFTSQVKDLFSEIMANGYSIVLDNSKKVFSKQ